MGGAACLTRNDDEQPRRASKLRSACRLKEDRARIREMAQRWLELAEQAEANES
jgi:hypothetical protein